MHPKEERLNGYGEDVFRVRTEVYVGSSHVAAASKDGKGLVYLDVNVLDFLL